MPTQPTINEIWRGSSFNDGRELVRDIVFVITGVDQTLLGDDAIDAVKDLMYANASTYFDDDRYGLIPLLGAEGTDQGGGVWTGVLHYSTANFTVFPPTNGQVELGFNVGSTTTRIYQSLDATAVVTGHNSAFGTNPSTDYKGAINVVKDGNSQHVEGTDIEITTSEFTITWYFPTNQITDAFIHNIEQICNTVNNAPFRGRAAGEVRLRGANGYARTNSAFTPVTFHFLHSPNLTTVQVGAITLTDSNGTNGGYAMKGHQCLWATYGEIDDATSKDMVISAQDAYVDNLYRTSDFSALGIGT